MESHTRSATTDRVISLDEPAATSVAVAGAKAANLARAAAAGLPVLPGFVVPATTRTTIEPGPAMRAAWETLSAHGQSPLVVRSSSVIEDSTTSSMAGVFTSVIDVRGWDAFVSAVTTVLESARAAQSLSPSAALDDAVPMAVLVQPYVDATLAGVLFGADPVTGRTDRMLVAVVDGGPSALVSGQVRGAGFLLTSHGRLRDRDGDRVAVSRKRRRALATMARHTATAFGGAQDIEWAIDRNGALWLLQARPITTPTGAPEGPLLGPGPVAETFPHPLSRMEEDLWVPPLRTAIAESLALTGAASRRRIARSPIVTSLGGRLAADLDLLVGPKRKTLIGWLDPRPPARRLEAAWRVGRLRAAMPGLAADVLSGTDAALADVGSLSTLTETQLLSVLERGRFMLTALHGHEILAGMLSADREHGDTVSGASVALHALADGRTAGLSDDEIVSRHPVVLTLVPPRIGGSIGLPATPPVATLPPLANSASGSGSASGTAVEMGVLREALRVRIRWLHELMARAATELSHRLEAASLLPPGIEMRDVPLGEVVDAVRSHATISVHDPRPASSNAEPLTATFRLRPDGSMVTVTAASRARRSIDGARGAGGGRGTGIVHTGDGPPPAGAMLVVRTLDPDLAPWLPMLSGLVAETGSVLSHLAILARELGVPTVVNVAGAVDRFPAGTVLTVDGATGEVFGMSPRKIAMFLGMVVLMSSGVYVFIYLYRWEWNRALFVGMLFIATEVALASALILERLRKLAEANAQARKQPARLVTVDRLRETRPDPHQPFAWLSPKDTNMNIFVPILMGAGVVLSAIAWVLERIARSTATPVLETRLARRLAPLSLPTGGLVGPDRDEGPATRWFQPGGQS